MERRDFLGMAVSAAAVTSAIIPRYAFAKECSPTLLSGTQLFSVFDLLVADAKAAIESVGDLGFSSVEFFGLDSPEARRDDFFGLSATNFRNAVHASGMEMRYSHISEIWEDTETVSRIAEKLGIEVVVLSAAEEFYEIQGGVFSPKPAKNLEQLQDLADRLNQAGAQYRKHGLTFGYHNHWTEFISVEETIPLDFLIENTAPDNFKLELDVAWLTVAGVDPVSYIERHSNRVISCHLKDFDTSVELPESPSWADYIEASIVEPGSGSIDFTPIVEILAEIGLTHAFVETDKSDDPLAAIGRGRRHLLSLDIC